MININEMIKNEMHEKNMELLSVLRQYIDSGRQDLADVEKKELDIISEFIPKQPTDEELSEYVRGILSVYCVTKDDGYKLSMKDMKPIMEIVKEKYPTANGKIVSQTLMQVIGQKKVV